MTSVWVIMLPEKTGIFTSLDHLGGIVRDGNGNNIYRVENEIIARKEIRKFYSVECLFLMGIDDTGKIQKNYLYRLPEDCIGKFVETKVK